jgi:pimeloyl-ACP methyl ester carboxylesterase
MKEYSMTTRPLPVGERDAGTSIIALHCSLGSGRQWNRFVEDAGSRYRVIAPDISGYGNCPKPVAWPKTLGQEVQLLSDALAAAVGPVHLVGHSYGGAIALKLATALSRRVRSLTLIEPVLPTMLLESASDRPLYEQFLRLGHAVFLDVWTAAPGEALDKFLEYWRGSEPAEELPPKIRARMIEQVAKLAYEFTALFAEDHVATSAASIDVPTLVYSGGLSPAMTQRIASRLASIIPSVETRHLPAAGHMLAISHAETINAEILKHIAAAEQAANVSSPMRISSGR